MAISVTHSKVSTIPASADPDIVTSDDWNDEHDVTITAADVNAAPNDATYLVTTASGSLSAEVAVGTTPGGELGGTWASPTVDTTHSGSSHASVVSTHEAAADPHTGYMREDLLDAAGDLVVASADNTPAKLPKGSAGQVLAVGSSTLEYHDLWLPVSWKIDGTLPASQTGTSPWRNRTGRTLTFVRAELDVTTAPTGQSIIVDFNAGTTYAGATTIFSTQGNRPAVSVSAFNGNSQTFNTTTLADGELVFPDLDRAGNVIAGDNLVITLWMRG